MLLRDLVRKRIEANQSDLDLSIMENMAGTEIVTAIAHAIPLSPAERQVLMETPSLRELERRFRDLTEAAREGEIQGPDPVPHPADPGDGTLLHEEDCIRSLHRPPGGGAQIRSPTAVP